MTVAVPRSDTPHWACPSSSFCTESATRRINRRYGVEDDAWSENVYVRIEIGSLDHWEY